MQNVTNIHEHVATKEVYIIDGARTPFIKAGYNPGAFSASDLAVQAGRDLLARYGFSAKEIDEVIVGCIMPAPEEVNIARLIALRLGCGKHTPAWTVQRNCASGLQAIDCAYKDILQGKAELVLAGGTEAMSRAPLMYPAAMSAWLGSLNAARKFPDKLKVAAKFRPQMLKPIIALLKGLTDATVNLNMGQTAEEIAYKFNIPREQMDEFAVSSHHKVVAAFDNGHLDEIVPIYDTNGNYYDKDTGVRADSSMAALAKLRPVFDKPFGKITAGNSSQVTDGAAMLLLASKKAVDKYNLPVLGKIKDVAWSALAPEIMGLGPTHAITEILQKNKLKFADIDNFEINEAFAAQVLGCLLAWEDEDYCKNQLHLNQSLGEFDIDKLNIDGGAIAIGHPVGASGARVTLHALKTLKRNNYQRAIASLCIGGGQGGAILLEQA